MFQKKTNSLYLNSSKDEVSTEIRDDFPSKPGKMELVEGRWFVIVLVFIIRNINCQFPTFKTVELDMEKQVNLRKH